MEEMLGKTNESFKLRIIFSIAETSSTMNIFVLDFESACNCYKLCLNVCRNFVPLIPKIQI